MTFCQSGTRSICRTRTSHAPRPCPYITTADMLTLDSIPSYAKPGASYDHESTWAYPATSDGWYPFTTRYAWRWSSFSLA